MLNASEAPDSVTECASSGRVQLLQSIGTAQCTQLDNSDNGSGDTRGRARLWQCLTFAYIPRQFHTDVVKIGHKYVRHYERKIMSVMDLIRNCVLYRTLSDQLQTAELSP